MVLAFWLAIPLLILLVLAVAALVRLGVRLRYVGLLLPLYFLLLGGLALLGVDPKLYRVLVPALCFPAASSYGVWALVCRSVERLNDHPNRNRFRW